MGNAFPTLDEAMREAERIYAEGEKIMPQWVGRRPSGTFYIFPDRRYHDVPYGDDVVGKVSATGRVTF